MNPIRRELLNGLFVLVVSTLLSVGFAVFQFRFNAQLFVWIVIGVAIALGFYVMFELTLGFMASTDDREREIAESMRRREEEWLKRVGNPARLELMEEGNPTGFVAVGEAVKAMRPGSDLTVMLYVGLEGGSRTISVAREIIYDPIMEQLKRGTIREYKRLVCFDRDVLANDHELKSGILRVGEGPGTISRPMGEHYRMMMETNRCSLYVAPAVLRTTVFLYGTDKAHMIFNTVDQDSGASSMDGVMFFYDPPNGEIIEQFRQIERTTERRMVAVHKVRFPEDAEPTAGLAAR